jgi:hypothetical protein
MTRYFGLGSVAQGLRRLQTCRCLLAQTRSCVSADGTSTSLGL